MAAGTEAPFRGAPALLPAAGQPSNLRLSPIQLLNGGGFICRKKKGPVERCVVYTREIFVCTVKSIKNGLHILPNQIIERNQVQQHGEVNQKPISSYKPFKDRALAKSIA